MCVQNTLESLENFKISLSRRITGLVSFWQETALVEAHESTVGPHAGISSSVVDTSEDRFTATFNLSSKLLQVVVNVVTHLLVEESESGEDASDIAWCWSFWGEDALQVFFNCGGWNLEFSDALFASSDQVILILHDIFGWDLVEEKKKEISWDFRDTDYFQFYKWNLSF